jgi:DNA-binding transcriptional LysR family regulator
MDIQDMRIFARVAMVQNLSAVGIELGLTPGTISKRIQSLEDELGVRLFDRTTRSIRITDEGRTFLVHVERILAEIEAARAAVGDSISSPKGRLKVSAPATFGQLFMAPAICSFLIKYPAIDVQIDLTDRIVNLQEEGYDVAIRSGTMTDSALIAKRLAPDRQVIVASPAYLAAHGVPQVPGDLARHCCAVHGDLRQWHFTRGGQEESVRVCGRLRSNNGELLRYAAVEGYGLIRASELYVRSDLQSGALQAVLTDYEVSSSSAIWAVYPSSKHMLPKLRSLLDFLAEWFKEGCDAGKPKAAVAPSARFERLDVPPLSLVKSGEQASRSARR